MVRYAYEKCSLESKEQFGINLSITRHVLMATWQERVIFVDFQKLKLQISLNFGHNLDEFQISQF